MKRYLLRISKLLNNVKVGNYDGGFRFHYVPQKDQPQEPDREHFNLLYKIVDQNKKKEIFKENELKLTRKSQKLNEIIQQTLSPHRFKSVPKLNQLRNTKSQYFSATTIQP